MAACTVGCLPVTCVLGLCLWTARAWRCMAVGLDGYEAITACSSMRESMCVCVCTICRDRSKQPEPVTSFTLPIPTVAQQH
ncbi:hypothetical protein V8C44DRAFT_273535 [Trichoderma aethiopicum]